MASKSIDRPAPRDQAPWVPAPQHYETVTLSALDGKTPEQMGGRIVLKWRSFWLIRTHGRKPVRIVHQDARKARKF